MRDEWFIRGNVPMTKREVRAVSISMLEISGDCVLLDIGAGTGSLSVEAAVLYPGVPVYAFERNPEALSLIRANAGQAKAGNIRIVPGTVPETLAALQEKLAGKKLRVFIGGTSGHTAEVLDLVGKMDPSARIVINVIALETLSDVIRLLKERGIEAEVVSIQAARSQRAGAYHLMKGLNPVYVISWGGMP